MRNNQLLENLNDLDFLQTKNNNFERIEKQICFEHRQEGVLENYFLYFSSKTYVVGTQKNRLNETVLFSTQNTCWNWWVRKYLQYYNTISMSFALSRGMIWQQISDHLPVLPTPGQPRRTILQVFVSFSALDGLDRVPFIVTLVPFTAIFGPFIFISLVRNQSHFTRRNILPLSQIPIAAFYYIYVAHVYHMLSPESVSQLKLTPQALANSYCKVW